LLFKQNALSLPSRVLTHGDFAKSVLAVRQLLIGENNDSRDFIGQTYYLLGWFVGDLGKHFGPERLMTASVDLELTRRHPENLLLGEYVMRCVRNLGVPADRRPDRKSSKSAPNGTFYWYSRRSPIFGWFHKGCLGLKWNERTSSHGVTMEWILSSPPDCRVWFLRGLADSDGDVHFKDKTVDITTSPNTNLIRSLLSSVGCHPSTSFDGRVSRVTITLSDAARIGIFNPDVHTHRRKILEKLLGASTFERRWPVWLQEEVEKLFEAGFTVKEVRDHLFSEKNVFVKLHTLNRKSIQCKTKKTRIEECRGRDSRQPL